MTSVFWATRQSLFPIQWTNSKIPGFAGRVSVTNYHGFSAFVVFSSVAARFFTPQIGGAGAVPCAPGGVFRIDHDEKFNQTTHLQYQPWQRGPWLGFNWRYDSGLVAGPVPCAGAIATTGPRDRYGGRCLRISPRTSSSRRTLLRTGARDSHHADQPQGLCPSFELWLELFRYQLREPRTTTTILRGLPPVICSTCLLVTTTCFTGTNTSGVLQFTAVNLANTLACITSFQPSAAHTT